MNVVRHAVGLQQLAFEIANDAADVFVQLVFDRRCDKLPALLGAENNVEVQVGVGAGHDGRLQCRRYAAERLSG